MHCTIVRTPLALLLLSATACHQPVIGYYDIRVDDADVAFVERDGVPIHMNIARPVGLRGPRPAVLWIHGGGWRYGERAGLRGIAETCAAFGYVSATTDYRLTADGATFPAMLEDVAAAFYFLHSNAERYGIDPDRFVLGGDSAGAHLALLLGMVGDPALLGVDRDASTLIRPRGIVNIYGPTDLPALADITPANPITRPLLDHLMTVTFEKSPQKWAAASPVYYVAADGPPILTIHGTLDFIVPFSQAERLARRCAEAGQPHRLLRVAGAGHGWFSFPNGPTSKRVIPAILHFIAETTGDRPPVLPAPGGQRRPLGQSDGVVIK